ncbi:GYD domain-containing protein [Candidatus Methylacidiphilum infernorum]|uniref:GYD domain-containing protein n=1 Tax=Candidatus Methylacidiphilum infernorum TaxID=511746 RepID=A0ABX7PVW9_9BACT|nr:GYD domain-containing protein [Candidatus Methylacidiphilum infernorum]QSR87165.1 GYD domain-containing protein [Candidatus Methylacidiphilum infernorum]
MATFIILSKLTPESLKEPSEIKNLSQVVSTKIKEECPGIKWKESYATLGEYDIVDIVEANDMAEVEKAAMILRGYGKEITETMSAVPWDEFVSSMAHKK